MSKVRVILDTPIYDGISLTFKAPCSCYEVDGLIVYYRELSEETSEQITATFEFKDAAGSVLTGIGNLFNTEAYVTVVLDTNNGFAYIQNACSNSYLENKFRNNVIRDDNVVVSENGSARGEISKSVDGGTIHLFGDITLSPVGSDYAEERTLTIEGIDCPPADLYFLQVLSTTIEIPEDSYVTDAGINVKFSRNGTITFTIPADEYSKNSTLHLNVMYLVSLGAG